MSDETQDNQPPSLSQEELDNLLGQVDGIVENDSTPEPKPEDAPSLDQSNLDSPIGGGESLEAPVGDAAMDDTELNPAHADDTPLDDSHIDDLIVAPAAEVEAADEEPVEVPDLADQVSSADIGSENVAAGAAPDTDTGLDQNLIDSLIAEASEAVPAMTTEPAAEDVAEMALGADDWGVPHEPANAAEEPAKKKRARLPAIQIRIPGLGKELPKITASMSIGVVCSVLMFSWLILNQHHFSNAGGAQDDQDAQLQRTIASAEGLITDGLHDRAIFEIDEALERVPESPLRPDAEYLRLKAQYQRLPDTPDRIAAESFLGETAEFAQTAPNHPRATEVLRWRGDVYDRTGVPLAALGVYNDLLTNYASPLDTDRVLLAAGKAALELDRPQQATDYLRRLREEFPISEVSDEAGLYQGDAYRMLEAPEKAAMLYRQVAVSNPSSRVGALAYARLAQMSFDEGNYDDAIDLLETRLATATTTDGNEDAYLLLARALRASGELDEAERVLRELTQFFPENDRTDEALVELSRVLEARGRRPEAANIARQAAQRFPASSEALENAAVFMAQAGDERAAAESLLEASETGPENPALVLQAARHLAETGETRRARETYERLLNQYPASAEAFEGRIEVADIYFDLGTVQKAIDHLEDLAEMHAESPRAVPVLLALGEKYRALGLKDRAAEAYGRVAAVTGEPDVLADAAIALFDAGDEEAGLSAAQRVDTDRLTDETAYRFLMAHGRALRKLDGGRALAQFERAYHNYPDERRPEDALDLLKSYLAADRTGAARGLVMELDTRAKLDPMAAPVLAKAAVAWGDHLHERRDFRAAAEAYSLAENAVIDPANPNVAWAKLQRANALLQLRDLSDSVPLLADVSETNSAWSADAEVREAYANLERRLAHEEPLPEGE